MMRSDTPKIPEFDPGIIAKHITKEFILECMRARFTEGKKDDKITSDVPNAKAGYGGSLDEAHGAMMRDKILSIMEDLRGLGLLREIPNGADRGISEIKTWNAFVKGGADSLQKHQIWSLMNCPLPYSINHGSWSAAYEVIRDLRVERGFDPHAGMSASDQVGKKALMQIKAEDLDLLATAAALGAASGGSGMAGLIMIGRGSMTCPKTDDRIDWGEGSVLAPTVGKWYYPPHLSGETSRFDALEPLVIQPPIRQVGIALPSGVLLMADWFRIPGFTEGVEDNDYSKPSINSDLGIDQRTQDHYERLGLMRIHTTNCSPGVFKDGDSIRVGHLDEDCADYWTDEGERTETPMPESLGYVCCDLWDVTFADREILIDILMAGAEKIEANGGLDDRKQVVAGYPKSREEAGVMLDAYVAEHDVARLEFEPGTVLQVTMATGHGSQTFFEKFKSPDLSEIAGMEDMFILSPMPVSLEPEIDAKVDRPDWSWPDRYDVSIAPFEASL